MNWGLFEPLVMFFGLMNSPTTFQTVMNNLFKELINEGVVSGFVQSNTRLPADPNPLPELR